MSSRLTVRLRSALDASDHLSLLAVVFLERVSRAASTSILLDRTRADPDGPVPMDTTEPSHFLSMASPDGSRKSRRPILNAWTVRLLRLQASLTA